jgi:hypothetical protein
VCFNYVSCGVKPEVYQGKGIEYLGIQHERQSIFCCVYEADCLGIGSTLLIREERCCLYDGLMSRSLDRVSALCGPGSRTLYPRVSLYASQTSRPAQ